MAVVVVTFRSSQEQLLRLSCNLQLGSLGVVSIPDVQGALLGEFS